MSLQKIDNRKVLSAQTIAALKEEVKELEKVHRDALEYRRIDAHEVERRILSKKKQIEDGSPRELKGVERDKAAAELKKLGEILVNDMCSVDELDLRDPFTRAKIIAKERRFNDIHGKNVERYKELYRMLEPDDIDNVGIEKLRLKVGRTS